MQKQIAIPFLLFGLFIFSFAEAQVKIGDNPQVIDPASILELESSDKVLVITRVDSLQMTTIVPNRGALVYNTTTDCVFYYDGTQWINMCGSDGTDPDGPLTADPIVNDISTIVITPTANGANFEVAPNSINSEQIVNGGINGVDIQDGSIGRGKLTVNAVDKPRISENAVGPYAIDRDSLPLSFFANDAGFITGANIVSADAGNVLTDSNGAFYDDSGLQTAIAANTTAIAADGDTNATNEIQNLELTGNRLSLTGATGFVDIPTADGSATQINAGNNITISGNGTAGTPYVINTPDQADPSITNELTDLDFDAGTNILSLTNGATAAGSSVNLSALAGGGTGTTELADGTTILGAGTTGDRFRIAPGGNDQFLTTDSSGNIAWATVTPGGGDDNQNAAEVPFTATGNTISTDVQAAIVEIQSEVDGLVLTGGGSNNTAFDVANDSIRITDGAGTLRISLDELGTAGGSDNTAFNIANDSLRITDGEGTLTVPLDSLAHTGTSKGIFFADENGFPAQTEDMPPARASLIWDYEAREVGGIAYGALGIGLDGNPINPLVKTHIDDIVGGGLSYPLQVQNRSNSDGTATGIVFAVNGGSLSHGKGVLAFERNNVTTRGSGDFHFLQDTDGDNSPAGLDDKSFSVYSNKDIEIYRNIITSNGEGEEDQVLTKKGTVVEWADAGSGTGSNNSAVLVANDSLIVQDAGGRLGVLLSDIGGGSHNALAEVANDSLVIQDGDGRVGVLLSELGGINSNVLVANDSLIVQDAGGRLGVLLSDIGGGSHNALAEVANDSLVIQDGDGRVGVLLSELGGINSNVLVANDSLIVQDAGGRLGVLLSDIGGGSHNALAEVANDSLVIQDGDGRVGVLLSEIEPKGTTGSIFFADTDGSVTENNSEFFWNNVNDRLGIGLTNPSHSIHTDGSVRVQRGIVGNDGSQGEPTYRFEDDTDTGMFSPINGVIAFSTDDAEAMRIDGSRNVGIGPLFGTNTIGARLHVDGNIWADGEIRATQVIVENDPLPAIPDYVFEKYFNGTSQLKVDYEFQSLEEIEAFVKKYNHLPGIKSAAQVKKEGSWNLSESNFQNLEKIEELYLHTINQEKEINKLKSEKETLSKELAALKKDVAEIKSLLKKSE